MYSDGSESPSAGSLSEEAVMRLVSVCMLAAFMRNYPITYLSRDERRVFQAFKSFATDIENRELKKVRCDA